MVFFSLHKNFLTHIYVIPLPYKFSPNRKSSNLKSPPPRPLKLSLPLLDRLLKSPRRELEFLRASRTISFKSTLSSVGNNLQKASPHRGSISCNGNTTVQYFMSIYQQVTEALHALHKSPIGRHFNYFF